VPAGGDVIYASDVTLPAAVQAVDGTNLTGVTVAGPVAGSPVVGVVFTAPPSGRVRVTVTGTMAATAGTGQINGVLGVQVRTGAVMGGGTLVHDGFAADPGVRIVFIGPINAGVCGSGSMLVSGLTPGASHNAQAVHGVLGTSAAITIYNRAVGVDPLP
jgi:hypothetical protein